MICLLFLATIFNFSLYIHLHNQIKGNHIRIDDQGSIDQSVFVAKDQNEQTQQKDLANKIKERFKRDLNRPNRIHQFNLPNLELSRVWSDEDETLKQKLKENSKYSPNYDLMFNDDNRQDDQDKFVLTEKPVLHPPTSSFSNSFHKSSSKHIRHRSHHQKRRLTTTTDQPADQDQNVEFFEQPQKTTAHTNDGNVWLSPHSRIPVSLTFLRKKIN